MIGRLLGSAYWHGAVACQRMSRMSIGSMRSMGGIGMPSMAMVVMIAAIAIAPAAYVYTSLSVRHAGEIEQIKAEAERHWRNEIEKISLSLAADRAEKLAEAKAAAANIVDPESDEELIAICRRSASCRSRGDLK